MGEYNSLDHMMLFIMYQCTVGPVSELKVVRIYDKSITIRWIPRAYDNSQSSDIFRPTLAFDRPNQI